DLRNCRRRYLQPACEPDGDPAGPGSWIRPVFRSRAGALAAGRRIDDQRCSLVVDDLGAPVDPEVVVRTYTAAYGERAGPHGRVARLGRPRAALASIAAASSVVKRAFGLRLRAARAA